MPYRGLGSGIPRVLSENCEVEFVDNKDGNQFTAIIRRPNVGPSAATSRKDVIDDVGVNVGVNEQKVLAIISSKPSSTAGDMANEIGITKRQVERILSKLRQNNIIQRVGSDKSGHWEIVK